MDIEPGETTVSAAAIVALGERAPVGAGLRSAPVAPPIPARPPRHRRRWLWVVYAVLIATLAASLADAVASHGRLSRTDAALQVEQAKVRQANASLLAVHRELLQADGLADNAAQVLARETAQLTSVRSQLAAAEADQFENGVSIAHLTACLSGVQQALNQISLGDTAGAAATINGVSSTCQGAEPTG
jgi:hypothetical protein